MNPERLIHMANSIGDFFAAQPDAEEARRGIATHIRKFWEPRMRRQLYEAIDQGHAEGLRPLVMQALQQHRVELAPAA